MKQHPLLVLALATSSGLLVGFVADFAIGGVPASPGDVGLAVILSPILAIVGGRAVDAPFSALFLAGGLLFWPVWALLAWRWLRTKRLFLVAIISLWSAQGFYQPLHRLAMVMSA